MRLPLIALLSATLAAAESAPWALGDPAADQVQGTRTTKAYQELKLKPPAQPILVAVLDSGVDITHEDLAERVWSNPREKSGKPGVDDDRNGFTDDLNGWNFLGSKDGRRQVDEASLEVAREYARLLAAKAAGGLSAEDEALFTKIEQAYFQGRTQALQQVMALGAMGLQYDQALGELRKLGLQNISREAITSFIGTHPQAQQAGAMVLGMTAQGMDGAHLRAGLREMTKTLAFHYDASLDASAIIGDDPAKLDEVGYGNAGVAVANADHGTHVAGIIGAVRGNGKGADGQCEWVRLLPVVVVPDGDERDKDVANGIRYAVDQGAKILNCSFGKEFSPQRAYVEDAIRYAETKGVLIVHGAGNDGDDNDPGENFPHPVATSGGKRHRFTNFIEVGASTRTADRGLVAEFSNYGRNTLDLFAPGVEIRSTVPGNAYSDEQGTSIAAPEVAGVAALVWSQYPRLSAAEVRAVLLVTARTFPDLKVRKPGTRNDLVGLADISLSGGIVDAYAALTYLEANRGKLKPEDLAQVQEWNARGEAEPAPPSTEDATPGTAEDNGEAGKGKNTGKKAKPEPKPVAP